MSTQYIASRGMTSLSLLYKIRHHLAWRSPDMRAKMADGAAFYEGVWIQAAQSVGAPVIRLGRQILEIHVGEKRIRIRSNTTSFDDPVTDQVAGDKPLVHSLLSAEGIPLPRQLACNATDLGRAWSFMREGFKPVVVKPARGTSGGDGVTVGVKGRLDLFRAMVIAGAFCDDVVVEELVEGDNYRLLYFDGEFLDAVLRKPPSVRGDGRTTLSRLIDEENQARLRDGIEASRSLIGIDWELKSTLRERGYSLKSVPKPGERVMLKRVVNDNRGSDNEAVGHLLDPTIIETGALAAQAVRSRWAGIDLITPDSSLPLAEAGGAIIEVNTTPGLYFHYIRKQEPAQVARMVLERIMETG